MRIWRIDCGYLDSQRLRASYTELLACASCICKSRTWGNSTGDFQYCVNALVPVHDSICAEMGRRTGRHADFVTRKLDLSRFGPGHFQRDGKDQFTDVHKKKDIIDLRNKWEYECYYYGVGRLDLRVKEDKLGVTVGRSYDQAMELQVWIRRQIRNNQEWFEAWKKKDKKTKLGDRIQAFIKEFGEKPPFELTSPTPSWPTSVIVSQ